MMFENPSYRDLRRDPRAGYGPKPCPNWMKSMGHQSSSSSSVDDYTQMCPRGMHCPYAHGVKEQLYHPFFFRTGVCKEFKTKGSCSQEQYCVFWHHKGEKQDRRPDECDYSQPLADKPLSTFLPADFNNPPKIVNNQYIPKMSTSGSGGRRTGGGSPTSPGGSSKKKKNPTSSPTSLSRAAGVSGGGNGGGNQSQPGTVGNSSMGSGMGSTYTDHGKQ